MAIIQGFPSLLCYATSGPGNILLAALAITSILTVLKCIYRITFHPLSKYPGPLMAKFTNYYGAYHAAVGDLHLDILRCHQQYGQPHKLKSSWHQLANVRVEGSIIRYGPDRVIVDSSSGLHDIYGHGKNVVKSKSYTPIAHATGGLNVLATIEKTTFRRKRRLISQGFSLEALKDFEPKMLQLLNIFCSKIAEGSKLPHNEWTQSKNMRDWCSWLTFDIIGEFGYGVNLDSMQAVHNRFIVDVVLALDARNGIYVQAPTLPSRLLNIIWSPIDRKMLFKSLTWREAMKKTILGGEANARTLFSRLLEAKDPETGQSLSHQEIMAEAQFLLVAGFETTATTLSSLFFYIANNPSAYQTLASEIRSTFSSLSQIQTGPTLHSCTYLWACIQETLRMSPAGVGVMWREVAASGLKVDNEYNPAGYDIGTSIYAIHHNATYFLDPFYFVPERWLHDRGYPEAIAQQAYNPFSLGPRTCIGRPLAMMEVSITMAVVLWLMDFRAVGEPSGRGSPGRSDGRDKAGEYQLYSHLTSYSDGPMMEFRGRNA